MAAEALGRRARPRRAPIPLVAAIVFTSLGLCGDRAALARPARTPALERSAVEEVIRQSSVDALFQDAAGYLWLGTREGLVRWDGASAEYWHPIPFDSTSLRDNVVVGIAADGAGHLWLLTRVTIHGPARVSRLVAPEMERFVHYPPTGVDLAIDTGGRPWLVAGDGVYRYLPRQDRFEIWRHRNGESLFPKAAIDGRDRLWILDGGDLERCRLTTGACDSFSLGSPPVGQRQLFIDGERVRVSTDDGIACFDAETERLGSCPDLDPLPAMGRVNAVARDAEGNLWLATLEGVWWLSRDGPRRVPIGSGPRSVHDDVYVLLGDRAGGMWAGTPWGLFHWDPHKHPFDHLRPDAGRRAAPILALHEDPDDVLWVGTIGDGVHALSPGGVWRHFPERSWASRPAERTTFVWSISSSTDAVWLATSYGLVRIDPETGRTRLFPLPDAVEPVPSLSAALRVMSPPAGESGMWVMARSGDLYRFEDGRFEIIHRGEGSEILDMAIEGEATIWLGMADEGLRRIDLASGEVRSFRHRATDSRSLVNDSVVSLEVDSRGHLWVGTAQGLDRLTAGGERFEHVLGPQDLPSNAVLAIEEGPQRLWLSTNRGLVSIDKEIARRDGLAAEDRARSVTVWDLADGVGNLEFNRGATLGSRDGSLLFGGDRGITRLRPEEIESSAYQPPIRLERVTVVDQDGSHRLDLLPGQPIEIGPTATSFTLELATIDFTHPPNNRFGLWLEGVDPDWIDLGRRRVATYARIAPGRYTLHGRVSNADGVWSDEVLKVPLTVVPAYYQTTLFRVLTTAAAVILVIGLAGAASRQRFRHQLERLRLEWQREEDRRRISRDLHDELGAGLTQIVLLSEQQAREPGTEPAALKSVADKARGLIDAIREIIWSIDPQHDRLDRLSAHLRGKAAEMLEPTGMRTELHFPEEPPARAVAPQLRRNLALILGEAVHNAIRHAQAESVTVHLELHGQDLELTVADDGRGFAPDREAHGNGLRNIRHRVNMVGGRARIDSRRDKGTTVRVRVALGPT